MQVWINKENWKNYYCMEELYLKIRNLEKHARHYAVVMATSKIADKQSPH